MSTVHCEVVVRLTKKRRKDASWLWLDGRRAFEKILHLGIHDPASNVAEGMLQVCVREDDVRFLELLEIAKRAGCVPSESGKVKPEDYGRQFKILRIRHYKRKDIVGAPLLRLVQKVTGGIIGKGFHPGNPLQLTGEALKAYLLREFGNQKDGWIVDSEFSNRRIHLGVLDLRAVFLCDEEGKSILEEEGLLGLAFREAKYDALGKGNRRLWFLTSEISMPKCLTRRFDQMYNLCDTNDVDGAMWIDGQYYPEELCFSRAEIERLGSFDVAYTQEMVGPHSAFMHSEIVVSQRFREVLERRKLATMGFIPVRIVDSSNDTCR